VEIKKIENIKFFSSFINLLFRYSSFNQFRNIDSNGSTNTITNEVKDEDLTPILLKKKSYSAPESDTSSNSIFEQATPVPKKKLSLDGSLMKRDISSNTVKELLKEKCEQLQEKDMDEASSYCSSIDRTKTASPAATLTSVI